MGHMQTTTNVRVPLAALVSVPEGHPEPRIELAPLRRPRSAREDVPMGEYVRLPIGSIVDPSKLDEKVAARLCEPDHPDQHPPALIGLKDERRKDPPKTGVMAAKGSDDPEAIARVDADPLSRKPKKLRKPAAKKGS